MPLLSTLYARVRDPHPAVIDVMGVICLIGIAPVKPAEYVIFRIGQWTAGAKV